MLSKVLSHRDAGRAKPMAFPLLTVGPVARGSVDADEQVQGSVALRETIQRLESGHKAERRESFEGGRRQGDQQARAELEPVLGRLHSSVNEVIAMRSDLRRRAET